MSSVNKWKALVVFRKKEKIVTAWECRLCEVSGRDEEEKPRCWNCGGKVTVIARPSIAEE